MIKSRQRATQEMTKLRIPENCKVVSPQPGTVFGFIGAEVFRKATQIADQKEIAAGSADQSKRPEPRDPAKDNE